MKGQIISGEFGSILLRQKSNASVEIGELFIVEDSGNRKMLLQVTDLLYGSQISQQNLELVSGMQLEEQTDLKFMEPRLRNYTLAKLKNLISIHGKYASRAKNLPAFFSMAREIAEEDLQFLTKPENPLYLGKLRSGSKALEVDIYLPGTEVLSHHILLAATTGRGKSNLLSVMLWNLAGKGYAGILVLDPHDEYYGRNGLGLKDHPSGSMVYYTSKQPPPGCRTLKIHMGLIKPHHFHGALDWSPAQQEALNAYYRKYGKEWIEAVVLERPLDQLFQEGTLAVIKRRLTQLLDLDVVNGKVFPSSIFDTQAGETTTMDIVRELEQGKIVVIDTSQFSGATEILVGSLIATEIFHRYQRYKAAGVLEEKPVVSIVLEEAPRVLGKEVLEKGQNIFSTIAREGRKFQVGLTAITQLPSLIPRDILANMNTKIILGIEMKPERQAIIESAAQDLSEDDRAIASLDKGEAIVSSTFARFATPVKIPLFKDFAKERREAEVKRVYVGVKME
ncbi:ATP-binding protein [Candidatus Woesearchaeota archaeon]|nr:ATP-binding protein [Candidatus Woesearchaeota archaeon]